MNFLPEITVGYGEECRHQEGVKVGIREEGEQVWGGGRAGIREEGEQAGGAGEQAWGGGEQVSGRRESRNQGGGKLARTQGKE